jgi:hypothetical protein
LIGNPYLTHLLLKSRLLDDRKKAHFLTASVLIPLYC